MGVMIAPTYEQLYQDAVERIRQLEKQCEVLAAEVHAQRKVIEAAVRAADCGYCDSNDEMGCLHRAGLKQALRTYQASKPK